MYYFLCKFITDLHNSIHFITGLNDMHKSSVRFGVCARVCVCVLIKRSANANQANFSSSFL